MIGLEMGETIASAIRVRSSDSSNAQLLIHRASIGINFIPENGIVAVLGDEDQLMNSDFRMFVRPSHMRREFPVGIASR
jgi:hypothetical protein